MIQLLLPGVYVWINTQLSSMGGKHLRSSVIICLWGENTTTIWNVLHKHLEIKVKKLLMSKSNDVSLQQK